MTQRPCRVLHRANFRYTNTSSDSLSHALLHRAYLVMQDGFVLRLDVALKKSDGNAVLAWRFTSHPEVRQDKARVCV